MDLRERIARIMSPHSVLLERESGEEDVFFDIVEDVLSQLVDDPEQATNLVLMEAGLKAADLWKMRRVAMDADVLDVLTDERSSPVEIRRAAFRDADDRFRHREICIASIKQLNIAFAEVRASTASYTATKSGLALLVGGKK